MKKRIGSKLSSAEAEAERKAAFEGEVPPLGRDFFERAQIRYGKVILREAQGTLTRRGRPPLGSGPKLQQSLRLSPEVLDFFKGTGRGWQARIDEVLRRHVKAAQEARRVVAEARDARARATEASEADARVAEERSPYDAGEEGGGDGE